MENQPDIQKSAVGVLPHEGQLLVTVFYIHVR